MAASTATKMPATPFTPIEFKNLNQRIRSSYANAGDDNMILSGKIVDEEYAPLNKFTLTEDFNERVEVLRKKIHETGEIRAWPSTKKRDDMFRIDANEFTIEKAIEGFVRDGCIIVENIVSEATCDKFVDEMKEYLDQPEYVTKGEFTGKSTKRVGSIIARSPASWEMVGHPIVTAINEAILGLQVLDHAEKFTNRRNQNVLNRGLGKVTRIPWHLHLTQVIAIGNSEPAQQIHQDSGFAMYVMDDISMEVSSMWAIGTEFTKPNGATRAIPGSYKWPRERTPTKDDHIEQADMPRGSAFFYLGRSWHSGGNNKTGKTRYGVNFDWSVAFLRQEENQYIACPPSIAKDLPKAISDQLGYQMGGYALGYVDIPHVGITAPNAVFKMKDPQNYASTGWQLKEQKRKGNRSNL